MKDPAAKKYAAWITKSCQDCDMEFELHEVARTDLEAKVMVANGDSSVNGILIFYPVFGDPQDQYLQNIVDRAKDVEGLCHTYKFNMYHNIRYLDAGQFRKCIIPCTPLAVVKILEYLGVYNLLIPYGNRLHGRTVTIVNRSEIVGRPLAALLANDGATVYSVDIHGVMLFHRGPGISMEKHEVAESPVGADQALAISDVVVTGVPSAAFKVHTASLREGVVAINVSTFNNFEADILDKASLYVASVGKVTVAMLQRNLLRLTSYQHQQSSSQLLK